MKEIKNYLILFQNLKKDLVNETEGTNERQAEKDIGGKKKKDIGKREIFRFAGMKDGFKERKEKKIWKQKKLKKKVNLLED